MKLPSFRQLKFWILFPVFLAVIGFSGWLLLIASDLPSVEFLADPGVSFELKVPDWQGRYSSYTVGPANPDWISLRDVPMDLRNAVLSGEDFSFYSHNGVDWFELRESILKDFRERRFARGASTITQQLAKNLFLSRSKTIKRKVSELVLTQRMEKTLTKDRILELYLNVVELGDMVYGVRAGARRHFGKQPDELTLRECAFLAAMLPGPKVYDPSKSMVRVMNRSDHLLGVMLKGRMITDDDYLAALVEVPLSRQPGDPENTDTDQGSVEDSSPPFEDESIPDVHQTRAVSDSAGEDTEMLTPQDGIIEIPIK